MEIKNNLIEELNNLIITSKNPQKTFKENINLFEFFYNNRQTLIKDNILDEKIYTIIKFILKYDKNQIFNNLIENLYKEQKQLIKHIERNCDSINNYKEVINEIQILLKNQENYDEFYLFLSKNKNQNNYTTNSLKTYTYLILIRIIHDKFHYFQLNEINRMLEYITKNMLILLKYNKIEDKLLLSEYFEKIIPLKEFLGDKFLNDDIIYQIRRQSLKNKQATITFFDTLTPSKFMQMFNKDINRFFTFLTEANYLTLIEKQNITNKTLNKILNNKDFVTELLIPIINNNQNPFWLNYLTQEIYIKIINSSLKSTVSLLDSNKIIYLLKLISNSKIDSKINTQTIKEFVKECKYLLKQEEYLKNKPKFMVEETKKTLNEITTNGAIIMIESKDSLDEKNKKAEINELNGYTLDFNIAKDLLEGYLSNKIKLNYFTAQALVKSVAIEMLKKLNIPNYGIYFFEDGKRNGFFKEKEQIIGINRNFINKFLEEETLYERLKVFEILFHEIKHAQVNNNKKNNIWNFESYEIEKEATLFRYDYSFYSKNYYKIKEEIIARINGIDMLAKFIVAYLPKECLDDFQDKIIEDLEKETNLNQEQDIDREMLFLKTVKLQFNFGFDTLIKWNPNIFKKSPIFNLEYYQNGLPKTYEDIWLNRNEENKELIDEILKLRYPDIHTQEKIGTYQK